MRNSLSGELRRLPVMQPPPILQTRLQIIASKERQRVLTRRDFATRFRHCLSVAQVFADNLLKPFAVPAAGGLLASLLCFGVIVDSLHIGAHWDNRDSDMPIGVYTEASLSELSPFSYSGRDVMAQLTVDATGHVTDFFVPQGQMTQEQYQQIGNFILYSTFKPAMRLGQAVSSKRMVWIGQHVSVKG